MLTNPQISKAKPEQAPYRLFDGGGLYLEVSPAGGRLWRFKYRFAGKERRLSFGTYPEVSLKEARARRDDARRTLRDNRDPGAERRDAKAGRAEAERIAGSTFESVATEWQEKVSPKWSRGHAGTVADRLKKDVFPWIGAKPVAVIEPPELLAVIRRIENRGAREVARRVLQICSQVFAYAVAIGVATRNPAADLRGAVPPPPKGHHASITDPREVGGLLRAIDGFRGSFVTRCALRFAPLVFVRPGELRHAEWPEFNTDGTEWRIPAHKMKARDLHIVPLSRQSLAILEELRPLTGEGRYLFPGARSPDRPMSENTVTAALRRLGYTGEEMTGHGFRTMASTLLNEQGWNRDAIERQLAHGERNKVRAAYNRAEHLADRRKMMQAWADYLDGLRASDNVVPIRRAR